MRNLKWLIFAITILLIISSCASEEEKKEKRKHKLIESINKDNGLVIFDTSDILYYVTPNGLHSIDYNVSKSEPIHYYTNLDSLTVREYTMTLTPTRVDVNTIKQNFKDYNDTQLTKTDIIQLFNSKDKGNLFKIEYPWIIIGRDFIANVSEPYKLIKVSHLKDIHNNIFPTSVSIANASIGKVEGKISMDKKFNYTDSLYHADLIITLYNDSLKFQDLPNFSQYKTANIPQEAWDGTWIYEDKIPDYKEFNLGSNAEILQELSYRYTDTGIPTWTIKLSDGNSEVTDNRIHWGELEFSIDGWNKGNFPNFYAQRENKINSELTSFKSKVNAKVQAAREKREQERKDVEKREMAAIERQAIEVWDIYNAYEVNPIKAEQQYPPGQFYYIKTDVASIDRSDNPNYAYSVWDRKRFIELYTNSKVFVDMDYPQNLIVRGRLVRRINLVLEFDAVTPIIAYGKSN